MEGWRSRLAWSLALAVGLVAAPWPGWSPSWAALAAVAVALTLWARPSDRRWLPAAVAWVAAFVALPHSIRPLTEATATADLDRHCQQMRFVVEELAADPELVDIFAASGEPVDPASNGRSALDPGAPSTWPTTAVAWSPGVERSGPTRRGCVPSATVAGASAGRSVSWPFRCASR